MVETVSAGVSARGGFAAAQARWLVKHPVSSVVGVGQVHALSSRLKTY